ncbi:MAGE family-domain-containing protein [Pilobolus umbonatus]|nr:MAGE family-domain-containing protein [Pilobolus umbonatus]
MERRGKRARYNDSDEEFDNHGEGSSTQYGSTQQTSTQSTQKTSARSLDQDMNSEEMDRKIKDFVRYALACQFKKKSFRRDEINKKVLLDMSRYYGKALEGARKKLKTVFGMDIVELPVVKDKPAMMLNTQPSKGATSGVYMLRSHLKEIYTLPHIIERSPEEYEKAGLLYVILALIFVNERQVSSSELYSHLDRLHITKDSSFGEREKIIENFMRGGYIKRSKVSDEEGDEIEYNYIWGPKAMVEIPIQNIVEFITDVSRSGVMRRLEQLKSIIM